ncbi:hypothetical protein T484DRAFT_1961462 [Baffinella frigidus]|nr:hypothetical protein T484DRAFT_1961462 [Cryptophyta sp. CCMP2293]
MLSFEMAPHQSGASTFQVGLFDGGGAPQTRFFTLEALPVNDAPELQAFDVYSVARAGAAFANVFAIGVTAGAFEDEAQTLTWSFAYDNPSLLASPPTLRFGVAADGGRQGVVDFTPSGLPGIVNFNVTLVDSGPSNSAVGDAHTSRPTSFRILLRRVNLPPVLEMAYNLTIPQGAGGQFRAGMVANFAPGPAVESDQSLSFYLDSVESLSGAGIPATGLFVAFEVGARDNGGTSFGGVDTGRDSFVLVVQPLEPEGLRLTLRLEEKSSPTTHIFASLFSEPADLLPLYTFSVIGLTSPSIFTAPPVVNGSGAVFFTVGGFEYGSEVIRVVLSLRNGGVQVREHVLEVIVAAVNDMPSFTIPDSLAVVEGIGLSTIPAFATSISPGPPNEASQGVSFTLTSLTAGFFLSDPEIASDGELSFRTSLGMHGLVTVVARIHDSGMDAILDTTQLEATTSYFTIRVFPLPVVSSISPRLVPTAGRVTVTLRGQYFGSYYSRGYFAASYGDFAIYIGGDKCLNNAFLSDGEVTCEVPSGIGPSAVSFNVSDGALSRAGSLVGPRRVAAGTLESPSASLSDANLALSRGVLALATLAGRLFVAGNFLTAAGVKVGHVLAWDGFEISPLGLGVDGAVKALAVFRGGLVAGGAFTRAFQQEGQVVSSGGLAFWSGSAWSLLGGASVPGDVTALLASGDTLYVAGRFSKVGSTPARGLARYDAGTGAWREVGGGVSGGVVLTLALLHSDLYVGGSFTRVGTVAAGRIARFDGRRWTALGDADGDVRALAMIGEFVFAGGDFSSVGGVQASNVARLFSGAWSAVGGGLNGPVLAMRAVGACVYMGGAFTDTDAARSVLSLPVKFVTRWCLDGADSLEVSDGGARLADFDTFPSLGPVRAILHYVPGEGGESFAVAGNCSSGTGVCLV